MKKVIITSNLYLPNIGGVENSLYYLAKAGLRIGDDVLVISSDIVDFHGSRGLDSDVLVALVKYKVPKERRRSQEILLHIKNAIKVYRDAKKNGYETAICRHHVSVLFCRAAGIKRLTYIVPGVVKNQNNSANLDSRNRFSYKAIKYKIDCFVQALALKVSRRVLVFSNNMKIQVEEIIPKVKAEICRPGVDADKYYFASAKIEETINLLTVSRINNAKNIEAAIGSLKYLSDSYCLTIVGDGPTLSKLKAFAKDAGVGNRVNFQGAEDNVVPFYESAHIFLLPSKYEPFGQTILEASASGVPTVAFHSDIVDTATVSILGDYGVYAKDLTFRSFAEAIISAYCLYYEKEVIRRTALREYILKNYSWEVLYEEATKQ